MVPASALKLKRSLPTSRSSATSIPAVAARTSGIMLITAASIGWAPSRPFPRRWPSNWPPPSIGIVAQQLKLTLRNSGAAPLAVALRLDLHAPRQSRPGASRSFQLAHGASQSLALPVVLTDEGGTLVGLSVEAGPQRFWIPLLTHVEDVGSVLQSIQQILADTPDAAASAALAGLQSRAVADLSRTAPTAWRTLFQDASRLRDRLLRSRIGFDALLFVKRKPYISEQPFMDAHHLWNRPGGGVFRLSPVSPEGRVAPLVDALGEGVYRDLALDWPAPSCCLPSATVPTNGPMP